LTRQLHDDEVERLYQATVTTLREWTARLRAEVGDAFPEKVTAFRPEMAVHGKFRQPCPVCGAPVQRIVYAENECNYCPVCQTGGRLLADRALSRLLKGDWPLTRGGHGWSLTVGLPSATTALTSAPYAVQDRAVPGEPDRAQALGGGNEVVAMLKTLLVPIDGSPLAARAIPYAVALARAAQAGIVLLRALEPGWTNREPNAELAASFELDRTVEKLRQQGVTVEGTLHVLQAENVGAAIIATAAARQADLIVMSTHGRSGIGRFMYGSVADEVLRTASVPVLLVPASCGQAWPSERPPRILVPLDRSELGSAALAPATELAQQLGGELILAHVVPLQTYTYGEGYFYSGYAEDLEDEQVAARAELEALAAAPRAAGLNVWIKVTTGFPLAELATIAGEEGADLVAMATHGRGGLARLVLGSVATATLQRAGLPVFLVRPTALPAAAEVPVEVAGELAAPAAGPASLVPTVALALGSAELDLLARGLGDLLYLPDSDPRLAQPARTLLARVQAAAAELPASPAAASR
jgi:nucleotide-binding universal stress UspA family protein